MTTVDFKSSPQTYARIGGILYLFIIIAALFGEVFVRGNLIAWNDPSLTATNINTSETLFRMGLVGELLTCVCDVSLAMILYVLLKPVNRNLALLAAFFRLTFISIYGVTKLFEIAALVTLDQAAFPEGFDQLHLNHLAYIALKVHSLGYGASLLFFGCCCILFGHLIYKSSYFPGIIGILLVIAGWCYVVFSLAQVLDPTFAGKYLFPWLVLPAFPAELGLGLWLLVKGVNMPKWEAMTQEVNRPSAY